MSDDSSIGPLAGRTIAITAERRSEEQAALFTKRGATVLAVPTMHTVNLTDDADLRATTDAVIANPPDWMVATTGFGMKLWFEAADGWGIGDALIAALMGSRVVVRGPKAQSACRARGLTVVWMAPHESMPEVVAWMAEQPDIASQSIAVQLFDPEDHPSSTQLRALAATSTEIAIYRWRHPVDVVAVDGLIDEVLAGRVDAITFTSQPAVRFLLDLAGPRADAFVAACNEGVVMPICIGPVCAEAGVEAGITTMVWPEPNRLVPMVKLTEAVLTPRS